MHNNKSNRTLMIERLRPTARTNFQDQQRQFIQQCELLKSLINKNKTYQSEIIILNNTISTNTRDLSLRAPFIHARETLKDKLMIQRVVVEESINQELRKYEQKIIMQLRDISYTIKKEIKVLEAQQIKCNMCSQVCKNQLIFLKICKCLSKEQYHCETCYSNLIIQFLMVSESNTQNMVCKICQDEVIYSKIHKKSFNDSWGITIKMSRIQIIKRIRDNRHFKSLQRNQILQKVVNMHIVCSYHLIQKIKSLKRKHKTQSSVINGMVFSMYDSKIQELEQKRERHVQIRNNIICN